MGKKMQTQAGHFKTFVTSLEIGEHYNKNGTIKVNK